MESFPDIVGIDAGGSKTRVVACSTDPVSGDVRAYRQEIFGPGNYRQVGTEGIADLISRIAAWPGIDKPDRVVVVGGFAGAGTPEAIGAIRQLFEKAGFRAEKLCLTNDVGLLLDALGESGIVLVCGTGSVCMGRLLSDSRTFEARSGGYGYRFASEPGGYSLGLRAIELALKMEDGRRPHSSLIHQRLVQHFELEPLGKITAILYGPEQAQVQERISGLVPILFALADDGDTGALEIVQWAVNEMAEQIVAVYLRLGGKTQTVALHGGLFAASQGVRLLAEPLKRHPLLSKLSLQFETLGVFPDDPDPHLLAIASRWRSVKKE